MDTKSRIEHKAHLRSKGFKGSIASFNNTILSQFEKVVDNKPNVRLNAIGIVGMYLKNRTHIVLNGQVKSGKRLTIQAISCILSKCDDKVVSHFTVTKLFRKDSNEQIEEHNRFMNLEAVAIKTRKDVDPFKNLIENKLSVGHKVIIHIDESDYGTGNGQILSSIFKKYVHNENVSFFYWSATNQELTYTEMVKEGTWGSYELDPGEEYKGAKWFVDNGHVIQSQPYWKNYRNEKKELIETHTDNTLDCMEALIDSDKTFGIVRFNGTGKSKMGYQAVKNSKQFREFHEMEGIELIFIDDKNSFNWGGGSGRDWETYVLDGKKVILVICQTCRRSTEIAFHKHIAFYHDHSEETVCLTTLIQSHGRVFHYDKDGHPIKLYANLDACKVAAGYMTPEEYARKDKKRRISDRIADDRGNKIFNRAPTQTFIFDDEESAKRGVNRVLGQHGEGVYTSCIVCKASCWNHNDLIELAIKGGRYGFSYEDGKNIQRLYYLDGENEHFKDSWANLKKNHPEMVGKYVYVFQKKADVDSIETPIFHTRIKGRNSSMYHV